MENEEWQSQSKRTIQREGTQQERVSASNNNKIVDDDVVQLNKLTGQVLTLVSFIDWYATSLDATALSNSDIPVMEELMSYGLSVTVNRLTSLSAQLKMLHSRWKPLSKTTQSRRLILPLAYSVDDLVVEIRFTYGLYQR
jgi:hypothetical protein